ncbi:MAG: A-factor biosynthesis repeat protein [Frankiales bacterium]|nr:A-factor biosynthesis repeat protein [Frankiales bacterium]
MTEPSFTATPREVMEPSMCANVAINVLCLIGDRFAGFAEARNQALTVSQFVAGLRSGAYDQCTLPLVLVCGQGVTDYERSRVGHELQRRTLPVPVTLENGAEELCVHAEVHKYREPNVLIAGLHRVDDTTFRASLRLHNDNELLLDHQTGQHVQGIVVMEAARQMFLAVSERYYVSLWPKRDFYYVIHSMNTNYRSFLFPLPTAIEYRVAEAKLNNPRRLGFKCDMDLLQAGTVAASTHVSFTALDPALIKSKEDSMARRALDTVTAGTASPLSHVA